MLQPGHRNITHVLNSVHQMLMAPSRDWNVFQQIFADHWETFRQTQPRYQTAYYADLTLIGRMVQHALPKGFKRIRYYGVQATKTFAKVKMVMQEALATVQGVVKGAVTIMARLTYRQHYERSTERDPLQYPHCGKAMTLWRIWHPRYGVVYDEGQKIQRGMYSSPAQRAGP